MGSNTTVITFCYLCHCGHYHPIGTECKGKTKAIFSTIVELKKTIEKQDKELRELLAMKRYIEKHHEYKQYYR